MAGVALTYELDGLPGFETRLRRLERADRTALADKIGVRLEESAKERIATTKTAADGTPWAEWSAGYHPGRQGASLLHLSGDLRDSISFRASADAVVQGADRVYAAIHQLGGDVSQGHPDIPARPYLGVSEDDREFIVDLTVDWLRGVLQ